MGVGDKGGTTSDRQGDGGIYHTFFACKLSLSIHLLIVEKLMKFNRIIYINQREEVRVPHREHNSRFRHRHTHTHSQNTHTQICPCFVIKCFVSILYEEKINKIKTQVET